MPMTLPIASTPSPTNSPSSEESSLPRTPVSPTMSQIDQAAQQPISKSPSPSQQPQQQQSIINNSGGVNNTASSQAKRKPSRRANTAERRATHNAVERQRRETLNGRFLDLAALLPNLSQIRRPSKSSIVNSSIAHIHASRRHRMHAARELRLLKSEADALRGELNEWRDRTGIPRIDEPMRSEAFAMVMSAELEVLAAVAGEEDEEDMGYGGYDGEDDGYAPSGHVMPPVPGMPHTGLDDLEDSRMPMLKVPSYGVPAHPVHAHHGSGNALHLGHIMPRSAAQGVGHMMASPTGVSFDNPAVPTIFDSPAFSGASFITPQQSHSIQSLEAEKIAAWNAAQMYHSNGQMMPQPRSMFTPASHPVSTASPGHSSHSSNGSVSPGPHMSSSPVSSHSGIPFNEAEFYQGHGDRDMEQSLLDKPIIPPAISSMRNRSASLNINMGMGSPGGSPTYDLGNSHGDYGLNMSRHSGVWTRDADIAINGLNVGMGIGVGVGMNAVAVGGGGNGTGFAMMM